MLFSYTAVNSRGKRLTQMLNATDLAAAQHELMSRGLYVLELEQQSSEHPDKRSAAAAPDRRRAKESTHITPSARISELLLFTRQMTMMLKAGGSVVPAIRAIREQPGRAAWHALLDELAESVEGGNSLMDSLACHPKSFSGTFRGIIGAGEATGTLADSFTRIADLLESRQRLRKRVIGALTYPCVLMLLTICVVTTMTLFVLPRFADLFEMLDAELPMITRMLLATGGWLKTWWPPVVGLPLAILAGLISWIRTPAGQQIYGRLVLRVPLLGPAVSGVILSQLLLVWAALLRSRVSVLEAIHLTRELTTNIVFKHIISRIEQAISEGRSISSVMRQSDIIPPPVVAAIATGEESGHLGESMEFVGSWTEEETDARVAALTRVLEPCILLFMGLVVGTVCVAMFLPLFDIATAAG
ncbi:MAG: type II secretion system F family protein [Planctomycetota bacterium]